MDNKNIELGLEKALNLYQKKGDILIVDVRTAKKEWEMTGVIPKSVLINMHDDDNQERERIFRRINKGII